MRELNQPVLPSCNRLATVCALLAMGTLLGASGCATARKEPPPESAASSSPRQAAAQSPQAADNQAAPAAAPKPIVDDEARQRAVAPEGEALKEKKASSPGSGSAAPARKAGAPAAAAGSRAELAAAEDAAQPLGPAFAESPALLEAIAEFDQAATALSHGGTCTESCKALRSMERSRERICGLAANSDPLRRCSSATSRLEGSRRELSQRCTDCR